MSAPAVVIGGGPAGLMAAEQLSRAGLPVLLCEAMPSVGRKFLMAGKSGLNLTKDEPTAQLRAAYAEAAPWLAPMLGAFGPDAVQDWARGLGQDLFTGSSGRVFPTAMKASPLLRAWLGRLRDRGVAFRTRWRWRGWDGDALVFDTPEGRVVQPMRVAVLALGGASWPRLGSDGGWAPLLAARGVALAPFRAANVGLRVAWSERMAKYIGHPVKGAALRVAGRPVNGEFVITARGLEGGGIYAASKPVREGAALTLDLRPGWDAARLSDRLAQPRGRASLTNHLRKAARLDPLRLTLLREFAHPLPEEAQALAALLKSLPVPHLGPNPLPEAISTAGGVVAAALSPELELRAVPGVFAAGEMLDWEAPTGGYLLTACLATGRHAGLAAATRAG
ncbi:TIGR03862 family flavoprotein [Brevirhabdus sp.]|uniref:TIGR03862 family flavoprotein n=1 Tax=Brevirhabdus sp. TaxID=2004514 RepID=UPI00405987A0